MCENLDKLFTANTLVSIMLDAFPCPIFIKNNKLEFLFINKAYENFFGVTLNQIKGKTVMEMDYLRLEDRKNYQEEDEIIVTNTISRHHEFDYTASDEKVHHCLYWSCGFCYENDEEIRGLIGFLVDVSTREKAQTDLFKKVQELTDAYFKLEDLSVTDHLTGLKNRRSFTERIINMTKDADEANPFCLVMLDIDFFKQVNDTYGHDAGDVVLKSFAKLLTTVFRQKDSIFRWGGEEFAILLNNVELGNAIKVVERFREKIKTVDILNNGRRITVSGGITQYIEGDIIESLLKRADMALYEAKSTGRDKIVSC